MAKWVRLAHGGGGAFGLMANDGSVAIHRGDMFDRPTPIGEVVPADTLLTAMWPGLIVKAGLPED